jgi:hypothetical protein
MIKKFVTISSDSGHVLVAVAVPMLVSGTIEVRWFNEGVSRLRVNANVAGLEFDIPLVEIDWRNMSKGVKIAGFTMKAKKATIG